MTAFSLTKVGRIGSGTGPFYYPCAIDTSDVPDWPWTVTVYSSTDHGTGGISMFGAVGDPTVPANWESYDTALAAGRFNAFATKPAGNPIYLDPDTDDAETPHIVKVGSSWYLTSHDDTGTEQVTRLAIATGAPLNFTRYGTNSGKIISALASPNSEYPRGESAHTGYYRWGANPFPDVPYDYIGYSLFSGGEAARYAMWGSDDATAWTLITILDNDYSLPGFPAGWRPKWTEIDPQSIRDAGNGEYVCLVSCGNAAFGSATRYASVWELYLGRDGHTFTREPREVLALGATGAYDEYEVGQPTSLVYDGDLLCLYQGADSAGANSLMIAVGSVDAAAAKPDPVSLPNHTKQIWDARGASALPSWLEADGTAGYTFTANGVRIAATRGLRYTADIDPATVDWLELFIRQSYNTAVTAQIPVMQFTTAGPGTGPNGVFSASFVTSPALGKVVLRAEASDTVVNEVVIPYIWNTDATRRHHAGVRWVPSTEKIAFLGGGRHECGNLIATNTPAMATIRPRLSALSSTIYWELEQIELRLATASGGVAPTITTASADATTVALALSESCIGDGTGLVVKANGSAVAGTWSRSSLTALTFTRASGVFVATDTITLDVSATDIRNVADLVAVQDVAATGVTNTVEPSGTTGTFSAPAQSVQPVVSAGTLSGAQAGALTAPSISLQPSISAGTLAGQQSATFTAPSRTVQPAVRAGTLAGAQAGSFLGPAVSVQPSLAAGTLVGNQAGSFLGPAVSVQPGVTAGTLQSLGNGLLTAPDVFVQPSITAGTLAGVSVGALAAPSLSVTPAVSAGALVGNQGGNFLGPSVLLWPEISAGVLSGVATLDGMFTAPSLSVQPVVRSGSVGRINAAVKGILAEKRNFIILAERK